MGVLLKDLFNKVRDSKISPWVKYPALVAIAAGIGAATVYGV